MFTQALLGGAAALALTAAPAGAATVTTSAPCYLAKKPIKVAGQGFAPGAPIEVESTGVFGTGTTDAAGAFSLSTGGPILPFSGPGAKSFTLNASDGTTTAQVPLRVTNLAFSTKPSSPAKPTTRVRWSISGFAPGKRVYAHYVHHGHQARRVSFGRMPKTCGVLHKRIAILAVPHAATGRWRIQLDTRKRYRSNTKPRLVNAGNVTRHIG